MTNEDIIWELMDYMGRRAEHEGKDSKSDFGTGYCMAVLEMTMFIVDKAKRKDEPSKASTDEPIPSPKYTTGTMLL